MSITVYGGAVGNVGSEWFQFLRHWLSVVRKYSTAVFFVVVAVVRTRRSSITGCAAATSLNPTIQRIILNPDQIIVNPHQTHGTRWHPGVDLEVLGGIADAGEVDRAGPDVTGLEMIHHGQHSDLAGTKVAGDAVGGVGCLDVVVEERRRSTLPPTVTADEPVRAPRVPLHLRLIRQLTSTHRTPRPSGLRPRAPPGTGSGQDGQLAAATDHADAAPRRPIHQNYRRVQGRPVREEVGVLGQRMELEGPGGVQRDLADAAVALCEHVDEGDAMLAREMLHHVGEPRPMAQRTDGHRRTSAFRPTSMHLTPMNGQAKPGPEPLAAAVARYGRLPRRQTDLGEHQSVCAGHVKHQRLATDQEGTADLADLEAEALGERCEAGELCQRSPAGCRSDRSGLRGGHHWPGGRDRRTDTGLGLRGSGGHSQCR